MPFSYGLDDYRLVLRKCGMLGGDHPLKRKRTTRYLLEAPDSSVEGSL